MHTRTHVGGSRRLRSGLRKALFPTILGSLILASACMGKGAPGEAPEESVVGLASGVISVAAGSDHTCALTAE